MDELWKIKDVIVVDGGFATEAQARGEIISVDGSRLWSTRLLHSNPQLVKDIHLTYLKAGADIIQTNTYSASVEQFCQFLKITESEAEDIIRKGVRLAKEAREEFLKENPQTDPKPLIAGSVGPYATKDINESEFVGAYIDRVSAKDIQNFQRTKIQCLLDEGVDILAIETIPAQAESEAIADLLKNEFPNSKAWISFSCKSSTETCHGERFSEAVAAVSQCDQVVAVGVNCSAPEHVEGLLLSAKDVDHKPFVVYPNSGEIYDWRVRNWKGERNDALVRYVEKWIECGAKAIGGCCRQGPSDVTDIKVVTERVSKMKQSVHPN